ncbi:major tail protein [Clostridium baratii]|uniref:major tail protein n=1 Tax=Clostridium baratii TaxID=1561 RepID=UPI0022E1B416|nr:major tail protein [Clostridium baratii]
MTTKQNNMPVIGVEKLHFAKIQGYNDDVTKTIYETPILYEGVKQIQTKPKVQSLEIYGDNRLFTKLSNVPTIDVNINVIDLTDEQEAYLLGHKLAEDGGIIYNENDHAPTVAMMFKSPKAEGGDRFAVYYAGQFEPYDSDIKGQEGKITPTYKKLKATFRPLANGLYKHKFDSDSPGVTQEKIDNFFKKVYIPVPKKDNTQEIGKLSE